MQDFNISAGATGTNEAISFKDNPNEWIITISKQKAVDAWKVATPSDKGNLSCYKQIKYNDNIRLAINAMYITPKK